MITFMRDNLAPPDQSAKASIYAQLTDQGLHATEPRPSAPVASEFEGLPVVDASVSRRYARALFSLALEEGGHERVGAELEAIAQAIRGSSEARALVENPGYTQALRHSLVDLLAQRLSLSPSVVNFLRLLVDRHRLAEIGAIARSYAEMLDEKVGRVRATVTSARPLSEDDLRRVREALAALTRRTIVLESGTDPRIVGGLVAQVGPRVFDGSIKTQLERMRRELKIRPI
jgi:F-type H+-transporting ATPase subunit delta